jgi:hypothetical protein
MTRWRVATVVCTVLLVVTLLTISTLIVVTIHDSQVIKKAAEMAMGDSPEIPTVSNLSMPSLPTSNTLHVPFARFASDLVARLEYHKKMGGLTPPQTLVSLRTFNSNSGKFNGWLLRSSLDDGILWLVFRGTSTKDEWKKDFELEQVSFLTRMIHSPARRFAFPSQINTLTTSNYFSDPDIFVHSGFISIYADIRPLLLDVLHATTFTHLCVTGHSLGAAQALYATLDLSTIFPSVTFDTIVFGAPRAGNTAFAEALFMPSNINSLVMLANTCDMVTDLPLAVQPVLKQPSCFAIYTHPGASIHNFTDNRQGWIANHMINVYIDYLDSSG